MFYKLGALVEATCYPPGYSLQTGHFASQSLPSLRFFSKTFLYSIVGPRASRTGLLLVSSAILQAWYLKRPFVRVTSLQAHCVLTLSHKGETRESLPLLFSLVCISGIRPWRKLPVNGAVEYPRTRFHGQRLVHRLVQLMAQRYLQVSRRS